MRQYLQETFEEVPQQQHLNRNLTKSPLEMYERLVLDPNNVPARLYKGQRDSLAVQHFWQQNLG